MRRLATIAVAGVAICMTVGPALALPDQDVRDRIDAWAKEARKQEAAGNRPQAANAWQVVVRLVDGAYPIDDDSVNGEPRFDPAVPSDGQANPGNRSVQIGPTGMRSGGVTHPPTRPFSQGWLAGVKAHEAEHAAQFESGRWQNEPINRAYHEVLAYAPPLTGARDFGLTKEERDEFLRRARKDLNDLKNLIRDSIARSWETEKNGGNIPLSNEYVKFFNKMKKVIELEHQGKEVGALRWKLELKKEIEDQENAAHGMPLARLNALKKQVEMLIKAEELVEKYALINHLLDASEAEEGATGEGIGLLTSYVDSLIEKELAGQLEEALKQKRELLEKLKRARARAGEGAQASLDAAEQELQALIRKEEAQVPPPAPTPVPPPPGQPSPTPTPGPLPEPAPTPTPAPPPTLADPTPQPEVTKKQPKFKIRIFMGGERSERQPTTTEPGGVPPEPPPPVESPIPEPLPIPGD